MNFKGKRVLVSDSTSLSEGIEKTLNMYRVDSSRK